MKPVYTKSVLLFPNRHDDLIYYITHLADFIYQKDNWINPDSEIGLCTFSYIVHFIFDDTQLSRDANDCIGDYLRNLDEANHIRAVVDAVEVVFGRYGVNLTDAEYIAVPEWPAVVAAAAAALVVLTAPDEVASPPG